VNPNERTGGESRNLCCKRVVFVGFVADNRARIGDLNIARLIAKNYKLDALLIAYCLNGRLAPSLLAGRLDSCPPNAFTWFATVRFTTPVAFFTDAFRTFT
jgi:hypothetical protein